MKGTFIAFLLFAASIAGAAQECYRFTYLFYQKREKDAKFFKTNEMTVDYDGKTSFFYGEVSYLKDSLNTIAFDRDGNISDESAYSQITRLPAAATDEKAVIDFAERTLTQYYHDVAAFEGTMPLTVPQWTLTDEEKEIDGHPCAKAECDYLGRKWTAWYRKDVSVSAGPWFLWGAPGLIHHCSDSENLIKFRLVAIEKAPASRLKNFLNYRKINNDRPRQKVYSMPMSEMEIFHTKYRRDVKFFNQIHGVVGGYAVNAEGTRIEEPSTLPYIPLIPDEFWKQNK